MFGLKRAAKYRVMLALIVGLLMAAAWPVAAANIYLDYTCILKEALESANHDRQQEECEAGSGTDTIFLTRDDKPRSGRLPSVVDDLVFEGNNYTIHADPKEPAFRVKGAHLTIRNLRVRFEGNRSGRAFEVTDGRLTLINVVVQNCKRGVRQRDDSHTSISGNSDICGLPADEIVTGDGTSNIVLPQSPGTCAQLPAGAPVVSATYGLASGVQCTRMDASNIGNLAVIDAGFIDALDVWGYVEQGVEVCFAQLGSVTFLDAATVPRAISTIDSYGKNGGTCVHLTRAGTAVLVPGAPSGATPPVISAPAASQPTTATSATPGGCPVHLTGHLFLRDMPSLQGTVLDAVPRGSNLVSPTRTTFWYQVTYNGRTGWIGHKYVRANC